MKDRDLTGAQALPGATLAWLSGALALALLPHLARLPPWVSVLTLGLGALRWLLHRRRAVLPPRWLVLLVALLGAAGIFAYYGTLLGRNPGVALLALMLACKLLETVRLRDTMLVVFLGYFLVVTNLLFSQSIGVALYLLAAVWGLTAALVELTHPGDAPRATLRLAGRLLLQALPVMAVMFLLFPRLGGPLWGLPKDAVAAATGLSERMRPGTISQLSRSEAVAFRVRFAGRVPPPALRYWRGPVFWYTDGREWQARPPGERVGGAPPPAYRSAGEPLDYVVTLEPHQRRWLFALDLPLEVESAAEISADFQALAREPVRSLHRYAARSHTAYRTRDATARERRDGLQLPRRVAPRVRALAEVWRAAGGSPEAIIAQALRYFRDEPFVYTLNPPLLGDDPIDGFLFDTRRGFCEHYAAAFTLLMRLAGVPARVVTGYQGGEMNPLGGYLMVRQSDAHAWAEVLLPGRGWLRVDPTAAVAPQRIERGIQPLVEGVGAPVRFELPVPDLLERWSRQARYGWDRLQNGWNQWVLGYGPQMQQHFLQLFGLGGLGWRGMGLLLVTAVGGLLAMVTYTLLRQERPRHDPVVAAYRRFCRRLARCGLPRRAAEGPLDYARRVGAERPEWHTPVERITALYIALRYGADPRAEALAELERKVRAFRT